MDGEQVFWVRIWTLILSATVALIWGCLAFQAVQMHTLVSAGYCERYDKSTWIKCDLLKDVVLK